MKEVKPMVNAKAKKSAADLLVFMENSPTAVHAVAECLSRLQQGGFKELDERTPWAVNPGGRYLIKRHESALIAVRMGSRNPAEKGLHVIGAHTDSPGFRLKPNALYNQAGYAQLGVEIYGGPLLASWTDRDLGLAGRAVVSDTKRNLTVRWLKLDRPIVRIAQLPIHMNREVNDQGLVLNKQEHLAPILGLSNQKLSPAYLKNLIADTLSVEPAAIVDWEMELYDTQKPVFAGAEDEFIFGARIDNLAMCHAALCALLDCPETSERTRMIVFYDSEEVGSTTANGADSSFLSSVLTRLMGAFSGNPEDFFRATARSFFISADAVHAVHPNYLDKYEKEHHCFLNRGPVIKVNALRKYATTAESSAFFSELCRRAGVPFQKYVNRTDMAGGSTIGPVNASRLGMATVDVGNAMLSMHSIREMAGTIDQLSMIKVFKQFFKE